jgi:thiol-disulfide isomerase/thioredoxin
MKTIIAHTLFFLFIGINVFGQQPIGKTSLDSLMDIRDSVKLNIKLKTLFAGSENDLFLLSAYYKNSPKLLDSVMQIAVERYPKGITAFTVLYSKALTEDDPIILEQLLFKIKEDFSFFNAAEANMMLSYAYAKSKEAGKALTYLEKTRGAARRSNVSKVLLIIMEYDIKASEAFVIREIKSEEYSREERLLLLDVYAQILNKKGDYQKAFDLLKEVYNQTPQKTPKLEATYYYLLSKTGGYKEAFPKLTHIAENGLADEDLLKELKRVYAIIYPKRNANEFIAGIDKQFKDSVHKEILRQIINEPSPNFTVTDLNGKVVSLGDFKGKTIVLDFWATWCVPCKKSLPAMQMTVNRYKGATDVKFLFIHTLEDVPDPKSAASKYFKENSFQLPLFMDFRDPSTKKCPAVTAFNVQAIPAKFVIDGHGNIRFKISGFKADHKAAAEELSTMIEITREATR